MTFKINALRSPYLAAKIGRVPTLASAIHTRSITPMNAEVPEDEDPVVCRCSGTTLKQIQRYMEKGVTDLDGISRASGACSGCGGCESDLIYLMAELEAPRAEPRSH